MWLLSLMCLSGPLLLRSLSLSTFVYSSSENDFPFAEPVVLLPVYTKGSQLCFFNLCVTNMWWNSVLLLQLSTQSACYRDPKCYFRHQVYLSPFYTLSKHSNIHSELWLNASCRHKDRALSATAALPNMLLILCFLYRQGWIQTENRPALQQCTGVRWWWYV